MLALVSVCGGFTGRIAEAGGSASAATFSEPPGKGAVSVDVCPFRVASAVAAVG